MNRLKLPTLLVITTNSSVRFWVKKHLDNEFFIIDCAKRGVALEVARTATLDFIILDSEFEDCDALQLCDEMRKMLRTLTPILLITGRLKQTYLHAALDAGVTDFLSKHLDLEELRVRIATIEKSYSLREKTQEASAALSQKWEELSSSYLKNKILLHNQALHILIEARKQNMPVAVLIFRIDRFHEIQDRFGYLVAEKILVPVSDVIVHALASSDLLIPSGEGRFIIVMKNKTAIQARSLAEGVCEKMKKASFEMAESVVQITISAVISSLEGTEKDFTQKIDRAFKAFDKARVTVSQIILIDTETV